MSLLTIGYGRQNSKASWNKSLKEFHTGFGGRHAQMTKELLRDGGGPIDSHRPLMPDF